MLCFRFVSHEYYSNVLWVLNIGINIDICKTHKLINYSGIKKKKILHAHNVRQSLPHTYNITNNKNKIFGETLVQ